MSFKKLKVTNKELTNLLKPRTIDVPLNLIRKKLLKTFKSYDKTDLQRLAELRNLKVSKKLSIDELEKLLITSVNLEQVHRELNNLNLFNTDNIKKAIDNLKKQIETKKKHLVINY